jgi:uncharacterized membrane protein
MESFSDNTITMAFLMGNCEVSSCTLPVMVLVCANAVCIEKITNKMLMYILFMWSESLLNG